MASIRPRSKNGEVVRALLLCACAACGSTTATPAAPLAHETGPDTADDGPGPGPSS